MINRDDIEAGDKCYTRDGGCLVAREYSGRISLAGYGLENGWDKQGLCGRDHPLDIVRIEKAPKPVVEEVWLSKSDRWYVYRAISDSWDKVVKLTFIDGKLEKWEQVK